MRKMIVRITKVSGGTAMRTNTIVGVLGGEKLPEIGENAVVVNARPLEDPTANIRAFSTSLIESY